MSPPDLNIIVCVDPRRCLNRQAHGRNGEQLLEDLKLLARQEGLDGQVQITPCFCIFGCTYGPRIDIARRWSGEKLLYGCASGPAVISRRGLVEFSAIPLHLPDLIHSNLPDNPPAR
jgi:hypothetical protein